MAYTTIDKPTDYFRIKTYSGNGTSNRAITWDEDTNMRTDFGWLKERSNDNSSHLLMDIIRGNGNVLFTNTTSSEQAFGDNYFKSLDANGFTVGNDEDVNGSDDTYVVWGWNAGGSASSNTDGSITSTVSANTTSGFSVVSYTGTGSNATVGHGLSSATPSMIIVKNRSAVKDWVIYHKSLGNTKFLEFTTSAEQTASNRWNSTTPTSSVFSLGSDNGANGSGNSHIAYCFAEKKGFSKFGSYVGNGSTSGTYVHLGFKPAFVIQKASSTSSYDWVMLDNKRDSFNVADESLYANLSNVVQTSNDTDFLSNGFKLRSTAAGNNGNGTTYIYMAFAENPFVTSTGIPTTAR